MRDWGRSRYSVRHHTESRQEGEYVRVVQLAWWLYDWNRMATVKMFPMSEKEQAEGLCKLLNSIEEEADGIPK